MYGVSVIVFFFYDFYFLKLYASNLEFTIFTSYTLFYLFRFISVKRNAKKNLLSMYLSMPLISRLLIFRAVLSPFFFYFFSSLIQNFAFWFVEILLGAYAGTIETTSPVGSTIERIHFMDNIAATTMYVYLCIVLRISLFAIYLMHTFQLMNNMTRSRTHYRKSKWIFNLRLDGQVGEI